MFLHKQRPSSAPIGRKPTNTETHKQILDDITSSGGDMKLTAGKKKKKVSEKEKQEREKVIDNLLERTKTLIDGQPDASHTEVGSVYILSYNIALAFIKE